MCASVHMCECARVRVRECASMHVCECASVHVYECASTLIKMLACILQVRLHVTCGLAYCVRVFACYVHVGVLCAFSIFCTCARVTRVWIYLHVGVLCVRAFACSCVRDEVLACVIIFLFVCEKCVCVYVQRCWCV